MFARQAKAVRPLVGPETVKYCIDGTDEMLANLYEAGAVKKFCKKKSNPSYAQTGIDLNSRVLVVGGSGSGKTNWLVNYLIRSPRTFARIVVCSKEVEEPLYQYLADKLKSKITFLNPETMPTMHQLAETAEEGEETCVVWDDVVSDAASDRHFLKKLELYFLAGRKCFLTQVFLSQSYFRCPRFLRLNSTYIILLKLSSVRDLKMVIGDFTLGVTADELKDIYREATSAPMQALKIDVLSTDKNRKFARNFVEYFTIDDDSDDE